MPYGIQLQTANGFTQISESNPALVVREEHTILRNQWTLASFQNLQYDLTLNSTYAVAPLVAMRSTTGSVLLRPTHLTNSAGRVDRVRFYLPDSITRQILQVIIIAPPSTNEVVEGISYGLTINSASNTTLFDSRWLGNVAVQQIQELSATASAFQHTNGVPAARQTVTLPYNNQNAFYCLDGAQGTWVHSTGVGNPVQGSVLVPSVLPQSITSYSVGLDSIRPVSGGSQNNPNASGRIIVFRYENF